MEDELGRGIQTLGASPAVGCDGVHARHIRICSAEIPTGFAQGYLDIPGFAK